MVSFGTLSCLAEGYLWRTWPLCIYVRPTGVEFDGVAMVSISKCICSFWLSC